MATVTPRWTRLGHDERRRQILAVARRLFSERHYAAVSTEEIARAAGIRRGLLHHYFGSKRDLFMEVARDLLDRVTLPIPVDDTPGASIEEVVAVNVDRWLDLVEHHAGAWFAAMDAEGFGRDPELLRLATNGRDVMVERIITVLRVAAPTEQLRAVLRAYAGLAEEASREWLQRRSLTRPQVHALLSTSLLAMLDEVAPAVEAAKEATANVGESHLHPRNGWMTDEGG
ncbi:MAG: TetR/AcrR family transcriptional regulator [Acidimicrobiales bacterium]